MPNTSKRALGIRFYEENPEKLRLLERFIARMEEKFDLIFVVINDAADRTGAADFLRKLQLPKTEIFSMNVWGKYTPALNAIVYNTMARGSSYLFLISPEIECDPSFIDKLETFMDDSTLVAGPALAGHEFHAGENEGGGTAVPWNTFAVWNMPYLVRTGFPLIGDAPFDPQSAGIEEVSTCAILQMLYPNLGIKLVKMPGIKWHVSDLSTDRIAEHIRKIASKNDRAEKQLKFLNLPHPKVLHLEKN